jgi:alpha-tubulin suppressor-like RCC1 family protein
MVSANAAPRPRSKTQRILGVVAFLLAGGCDNALSPEAVAEPFAQVVAGARHACGLTESGRAYCWGRGKQGQLGNGGLDERARMVPVKDAPRFTRLAAGYYHTCGLAVDGSLRCWGAGGDIGAGELGNGSGDGSDVPVRVRGDNSYTSVTAGLTHSCALDRDGAAFCWGRNADGQLGDGTRLDRLEPARVAGELRFRSLEAGEQFTCGVATDGRAYCWGTNLTGQLGSEPSARCFSGTPCAIVPAAVQGERRFTSISAGADHACALATTGESYCWGRNTMGVLGVGDTLAQRAPIRAVAGGHRFALLSPGFSNTCGLTAEGAAYCWGTRDGGQLGTEAASAGCGADRAYCSAVPLPVAGGSTWKQIDVGVGFTCGVRSDGVVYCWGMNEESQLGVPAASVPLCRGGELRCSLLPVRVSGQTE